MKVTKKWGVAFLAVAAVALTVVLAGCSDGGTYTGTAWGEVGSTYVEAKPVTVTVTSTTYKIEWNGKTAEGKATKSGIATKSGGTGTAWDFAEDRGSFDFIKEGSLIEYSLWYEGPEFSLHDNGDLAKKSAVGDGAILISPDDIEVIIIEE
jgi:hypothetical protein